MKKNIIREAQNLMGKTIGIQKVEIPTEHLAEGKEYVVFGDLADGELYLNILNDKSSCVEQLLVKTSTKRTVELEPISIKYKRGLVVGLKRKAKAGSTFSTKMIRLEFVD